MGGHNLNLCIVFLPTANIYNIRENYNSNMSIEKNNFIRQFLWMLSAGTAFFCVIAFSFYVVELHAERKVFENDELTHVTTDKYVIEQQLEIITSDIQVMANAFGEKSGGIAFKKAQYSELTKWFSVFAIEKKIYDQLRYVDMQGNEIVRVNYNNGNPVTVPKEQLQNKADRYYFQEMTRLKGNEIYLSHFDYNVEHGVLEMPLKPTVRMGASVYDSNGNRSGFIIVNILGNTLLNKFRWAISSHSNEHVLMTNENNYWTNNSEGGDQWVLRQEDMPEARDVFIADLTKIWRATKAEEKGQFYSDSGLVSFNTIYILNDFPVTDADEKYSSYSWKIVTRIGNDVIYSHKYKLMVYIAKIIIPFYLLMIVACWFLAVIRARNIKAEDSLYESERRKSAILETALDAVVTINQDGNIVEFNPNTEKMFGYSADQMVNANIAEIMIPDEMRYRHTKGLHDYLTTGKAKILGKRIETTAMRANGEIFPIDLAVNAIKSGKEQQFTAFIRDISEKRENEKSLLNVNRALMTLSAASHELLHTTDEKVLLDHICKIISNMTGYLMSWVGYVQYDEEKSVIPVAEAGFEKGYLESVNLTWADTERGRGPGGTAIRTGAPCIINNTQTDERFLPWREQAEQRGYASVIGLPLIAEDEVIGVLLIYSAQINAFDEDEVHLLSKLADELAFGIITIRTRSQHDLLQVQLRQSQKMEAIGQLTGGIAHDFNNILATIMGYAGLAKMRCVTDEESKLKNYLDEIYKAGERARDLVEQMLSFSRGGSKKSTPLQLPGLVHETLKMLRSTIPTSINISVQADNNLPNVMIDPVQVHQVVMNLCINARDSVGSKGQILLGLHRIKVDKQVCNSCHHNIDGDYVELSVVDNGAGIEEASMSRIFDPFYSTKDIGKGTGMGLSMVHGIIHEHGGHIIVNSSPGEGATFKLLFPVYCGIEKGQGVMSVRKVKADIARKKSFHIMVVDDEKSLIGFMKELLEFEGYTVTVETDSSKALEIFRKAPDKFDLIITDQTMPVMTGAELAAEVLALRPGLPVIMNTGYSEAFDEKQAYDAGISGYLYKPVKVNMLLDMLDSLLEKKKKD